VRKEIMCMVCGFSCDADDPDRMDIHMDEYHMGTELLEEVDEGHEYIGKQLTTVYTSNEAALSSIMKVYSRGGMTVADVTFGEGVFWKNIDTHKYAFFPSDLKTNGVDFTDLPYEDNSMDIVVFDPPYRYTPAKNKATHHTERYELKPHMNIRTTKDVLNLYRLGIAECERVLKKGGFLIIKCMDNIEAAKQYWVHIDVMGMGDDLACRDLVIVTPPSTVASRWKRQKHLKKKHSYFIVMRKGGAWPFGQKSKEKRSVEVKE